MDIERRSEGNQEPENPDEILNELQLLTLSKMERFGWMLAFVRKPLFQDIIPVLFHPDSKKLGTMNGDGALNTKPSTRFR